MNLIASSRAALTNPRVKYYNLNSKCARQPTIQPERKGLREEDIGSLHELLLVGQVQLTQEPLDPQGCRSWHVEQHQRRLAAVFLLLRHVANAAVMVCVCSRSPIGCAGARIDFLP